MSDEEIRKRFLAFCGEATYERFVGAFTYPGWKPSRLRYWQEKLWLEFCEQDGRNPPTDSQAVVALFAGAACAGVPAAELPPPVLPDKKAFLQSPTRFRLPEEIPADWLLEGWKQRAFRDDVVYSLARSVNKVGDFALAGDVWLKNLPRALDHDAVLDLYVRLRDESQRLEIEWRPAFEAAFQGHALPASRDEEIVVAALRQMIESGSGQAFSYMVEVLLGLPVAEEQLNPSNPASLFALAKQLQRTAMLSILEAARRDMKSTDAS